MAKISLKIGSMEAPQTTEVEGFYVPGTENRFAVHASDLGNGDRFNLTHIPTGFACVQDVTKSEAIWLARQLFAACPAAWRLEDGHAVMEALPLWVFKRIPEVFMTRYRTAGSRLRQGTLS